MKLHIIAAILLLLGGGMLHAQQEVSVDPASVTGPIKRMNAANNGPVDENMEAYKALRIPYARTHDTPLGSSYGIQLIDINAVFPDFKANPDKPGSYDFTNSDVVLLDMQKAGTRPFYRLGQSIEHQKKKYGIYPPADYKKWAKICEHIIRHYNEGWADGFHMGIEYWEIWNEPDLDQPDDRWKTDPRTWAGTMEQFNSLYIITAKHLKKCFPGLKIGGPAMANPRKYGPDFLDAVGAAGAPLDFFSWHMYHRRPVRVSEDVRIIRELLDEKGFNETESILNEWNYVRSWEETDFYSSRIRASVKGAAFVAGVMIECQNAPLDMLMYYDLRPGTSYNGAFAPYVYEIWPSYWPLYYWAELVDYGTQVSSTCDAQNIYTCAAKSADGNSIRLLVARYHKDDDPVAPCDLGIDLPSGWQVSLVRMTDSKGLDRKLSSGSTLTLESNAIALVEISRVNVSFKDLPEGIRQEADFYSL